MPTQDTATPSVVPDSDEPRTAGWRFFLLWMLTFAAGPASSTLERGTGEINQGGVARDDRQ
jgi:hypothetical protein